MRVPGAFALALVLGAATAPQAKAPRPSVDAEAARLFDSVIPGALKTSSVPGAVIVAVHEGRVIFRKGYGFADLGTERPMDPARTVLRIASVSKPVTAVLVMQLVEERRIALDEDAQRLLGPIRIENPFAQPVTVHQLLTHTAGLDKLDIGRMSRAGSSPVSLETYLKDNTPPVVRRPGNVFAYSNHGFALAGQIVATQRGSSFSEAARRHLFEPLGMQSSSFEITPELKQRMATGYQTDDGQTRAVPLDLVNTIPASMMVTTGDDFAKFLLFLLPDSGTGRQVLSAESLQTMERMQFKNHETLPTGYGYGLFVEEGNATGDWIWHTGDMQGWFAEMDLYPQMGFGVFMAFNSGDGESIATELRSKLQSEVFDFQRRRVTPQAGFAHSDLNRLTGRWAYINQSMTSSGRIEGLFDDGYIITKHDARLTFAGHDYQEVAPLVFQRVGDPNGLLAFRPAESGGYYATTGIRAYRRLRWYEEPNFHRVVLLLGVAGILTFIAPAVTLLRKRRDRPYWMRWGLAGAVFVAFVIFLIGHVTIAPSAPVRYGLPTSLRIISLVGALASLCACALPVIAVWQWRAFRSRLERSHYLVFSTCALALAWELLYWGQVF